MDLSGGLGGIEGNLVNDYMPMYHGLAKGVLQLDYKKDKFGWSTTIDGKWEPKTTDNGRFSYKNEKSGLVYKAATTRPLSASVKSNFKWTPDKDRNYSTWILYKYSNDNAMNHSINVDGNSEEFEKFSYYYETPVMNEHKVETGLRTYREFYSGRFVLKSFISLQAVHNQKVNTWTVVKNDSGGNEGETAVELEGIQGYAWKYRITPTNTDFSLDGDINLQMPRLDGVVKLTYSAGVRYSSKHSIDENSGATRIKLLTEEEDWTWKDSTRLRENFNFFSMKAEPYMTADFSWKNIEAHADYACQIYGRRLNNESHRQPLQIRGVYPVGNANLKWTISPHHSINLINKMSVKHPDYLKVCWYDRTAGYMDQLYRGNEQLISPTTRHYALEYAFNWKRFIASTGVSFERTENEIDQTWSNEEIDGRLYKIFRWINSADSRSVGFTQTLGWRGKIITANAGITYKQSQRIAKSNGAEKKSFDWRLNADISANLGKGWSIGMDAKYQSKVATFFTIFKEYCKLNAHVKKDFKRFTLYFDALDLLDQTMETSFESEELKEYWVEQVRNNRQLFILGVKWRF
ncbi:MAG: outer membrane beta-barrel protein [Bacteroidales bacterium]|nr:outer membrane beta-barrel protein [Bacteroidales bacterium]